MEGLVALTAEHDAFASFLLGIAFIAPADAAHITHEALLLGPVGAPDFEIGSERSA